MSEQIEIAFGWRAPENGARVKTIFNCEILERDETKNRWLVRLMELRAISAAQPIPPEMENQIQELIGRYAHVPFEAGTSMTLPMKIETLSGRIRYFHAADPRQTPK